MSPLDEARISANSFEEYFEWLIDNSYLLYENVLSMPEYSGLRSTKKLNTIVEPFSLISISCKINYGLKIANDYSSPVNGERNWLRNQSLPLSYPGFVGRMKFEYVHEKPKIGIFPTKYFTNTGVSFGSGGGGSNEYTGDVKMFIDDFPGIKKANADFFDEELIYKMSGIHFTKSLEFSIGDVTW